MNVRSTPTRLAQDSPSRQLLHELNRLVISDHESFLSRLDYVNGQREAIHKDALAAAAAEHEKVRASVELERQRLDSQIQAERERRDAENRRELERQRREKAERAIEEKKRELERTKAAEEDKRRLAEVEKQQQEAKNAAKAQQEKQREDAAQKAREHQEEEQKRKTVAQKQSQAPAIATKAPEIHLTTPLKPPQLAASPMTQPTPPAASPSPQTTSNATTKDPRLEQEHTQFLEIHKRLKQLRTFMAAEAKKNKALKDTMGDMRREMRKSVGQLTEGKGANRQSLSNILSILKKSLTISGPSIPVPPFLLTLPANAPPSGTGPALLLYLLNIFSKAIISQWIDEAGVSPKAADPVGIIASHIFAHADFKWHDTSLISILLAKFHKTCPTLFGIYGPETTQPGKLRLGWWRDENGFVSTQRHYERMTGLAAGFGALALRNYEKSKLPNPFPDYHYWMALARICNTPTNEITQTHFVVLKGMIENYEDKFIKAYGGAAVAALRVALVELPNRLPENMRGGVAVKGVQALVEVMKKTLRLVL